MMERTLGSTLGICWSSVSPSISGMLMSEITMSMSFSRRSMSKASTPLRANTNAYWPRRILRRMRCSISGSRSGSSSTTRIFFGALTSMTTPLTAPRHTPGERPSQMKWL